MHRLLRLRLLLTVLLVALVAACSGGGEETPTSDDSAAPAASATDAPAEDATADDEPAEAAGGDNVLAAAVDTSVDTSSRFRLTTTSTTPQGDINTSGEGVSTADGASQVTLTIEGAGAQVPGQEGPLEIETIFVDGVIYQRIPGFAEQLGTDAEWFSIDAEAQIPGIAELIEQAESADPTQSFDLLQQVADVEEVGTEEINGVSTTHYRAQARLGDLLEQGGIDPNTLGASADVDQQVPIDVWLDDEGRVRQLTQDVEVEGIATTTTIEILEYGVDAEISPPPADNTADLAELIEQAQQGAGSGG